MRRDTEGHKAQYYTAADLPALEGITSKIIYPA